ncbi:hypothetical protein UFOVP226_16 [uncultured Caudovirales phage]|uniref:Uncharacterized protein n=1 Tax=uncultured Caudovirales phage TaxID=2100421 RepID=A0A6J7WLL9_9CAUD|nr:hypothetical protein UFOVP226_16 [uncultured Caudovirales phage]
MATYKVLTDNFAAPQGATVTDDDLVGLNIEALIIGGHIKAEPTKKNTDKE